MNCPPKKSFEDQPEGNTLDRIAVMSLRRTRGMNFVHWHRHSCGSRFHPDACMQVGKGEALTHIDSVASVEMFNGQNVQLLLALYMDNSVGKLVWYSYISLHLPLEYRPRTKNGVVDFFYSQEQVWEQQLTNL